MPNYVTCVLDSPADFSRNRFDRIPEEVCNFRELVKLNCYHNSIRYVPEDLNDLSNLTELNLRCVGVIHVHVLSDILTQGSLCVALEWHCTSPIVIKYPLYRVTDLEPACLPLGRQSGMLAQWHMLCFSSSHCILVHYGIMYSHCSGILVHYK